MWVRTFVPSNEPGGDASRLVNLDHDKIIDLQEQERHGGIRWVLSATPAVADPNTTTSRPTWSAIPLATVSSEAEGVKLLDLIQSGLAAGRGFVDLRCE